MSYENNQELYDFVIEYTEVHGYPPSLEEISERMNISVATAQYRLRVLANEGYILYDRKGIKII